jgi:hypothetical protein
MKQSTKSSGNKSNKPDSYDDREDNPEHDFLPRIASRPINLLFIGGVLLLSTASTALFTAPSSAALLNATQPTEVQASCR